MATKKTCKTCKHWNNYQSELDYSKFNGICSCFKWKFNASGPGDDVMVLDRQNRTNKHMGVSRVECLNNEVPIRSRYCIVTGEDFGCIHYAQ
jgi:hypothetical protein